MAEGVDVLKVATGYEPTVVVGSCGTQITIWNDTGWK